MIYLLLSGVCAYLGVAVNLGSSTLLRPLLDAVSPLSPSTISMLCTMATLAACLVSAFFVLGQPLALDQDELLLLAAGAALGGIVGELVSARFMAVLSAAGVTLLQNALLFTIIALSAVYFGMLSFSVTPLGITRLAAAPTAFLIGLLASFLSFGAQPLTIALYFYLFNAENAEASFAALTVALASMGGKLVTLLIRERFTLPDAQLLLWLLPGVVAGSLLGMIPALHQNQERTGGALLRMSLFTSLINMAASLA